jgi:hypothetical protein
VAKISRPIIYIAVLGAVAYAVVLLTEPEAVKKKPTVRTAATGPKAPPGFTAADMTATFARYSSPSGTPRDAFAPKIVVAKKETVPSGSAVATGSPNDAMMGIWVLTGVSAVNGIRSALVENNTTGETIFLKPGDSWSGMKVVGIEPDAVLLVNTKGQQTRLVFAEPGEEKPAPLNAPNGVAPVVLPAPGGGSVILPGTRAAGEPPAPNRNRPEPGLNLRLSSRANPSPSPSAVSTPQPQRSPTAPLEPTRSVNEE